MTTEAREAERWPTVRTAGLRGVGRSHCPSPPAFLACRLSRYRLGSLLLKVPQKAFPCSQQRLGSQSTSGGPVADANYS